MAEGDHRFNAVHDVIVVGSGGAALSAALAAAVAGLDTIVLEKSDFIGGTTAISGAGTWIPANATALAKGIDDSPQMALDYIRASAPAGWRETEDPLWRRFVAEAPAMISFVQQHTRLIFDLSDDADPYPEHPGACRQGRMLSPRPLAAGGLGHHGRRLRTPHIPHLLTYQEMRRLDPWHHPLRAIVQRLPWVMLRLATGRRAQGTALIRGLMEGFLKIGGTLRTNAAASRLLFGGDGTVTGVEVEIDGKPTMLGARRGVVLASGGFEWDAERRTRHFPGPTDLIASPRSNSGDAHRMAEEAGAALAHMDQANIAPAIPTLHHRQPQPLATFHHREPAAILVGPDGRRFVNEYLFNLGEVLLAKDISTGLPRHLPAWLIADRRMLQRSPVMRHFLKRSKTEWLRQAADLSALAVAIGVPGTALQSTVARFNEFAAKAEDPDFGRHLDPLAPEGRAPERLQAIDQGPFVAMPFNMTFLSTKGGPRTDDCGRVLRPDASVIKGLYCAGVAMANPFGTRAVGSGTTIGPNLTWGYVCGRHIAGQLSPLGNETEK